MSTGSGRAGLRFGRRINVAGFELLRLLERLLVFDALGTFLRFVEKLLIAKESVGMWARLYASLTAQDIAQLCGQQSARSFAIELA